MPLSRLKQNLRYWQTKKHARRWRRRPNWRVRCDGLREDCATLFAAPAGALIRLPNVHSLTPMFPLAVGRADPGSSEATLGHEHAIDATQPHLLTEKANLKMAPLATGSPRAFWFALLPRSNTALQT